MLKNKNVLVLGLAKSGKAAIRLLEKLEANIVLNESKPLEEIENHQDYLERGIEIVAGGHPTELFERDFDFVVKNPGINYHKDFVLRLKERGIPVYCEIELGYMFAKQQHYYAVTGTNGKTTTVSLLDHILKGQYEDVYLAGNVGTPFCDIVMDHDLLERENCHVVLEMSNFQLLDIATFKPEGSTIINLTPDHLDYMASLDEYYASKLNIYSNQNQDDFFILNTDDKVLEEYFNNRPCQAEVVTMSLDTSRDIEIKDGVITIYDIPVISLDKIKLVGRHNLQNIMIAVGFAYKAGVSIGTIAARIESFKGVEHRIEFVREFEGVKYYNDSKGTNTDATITAIKAFDRPIILMIGGFEKNLDLSGMAALNDQIKTLITFGATKQRFADDMNHPYTHICEGLQGAIQKAREVSGEGDIVLLSPSTSSYDEFKSYIKRGEYFKKIVNQLGE